MYKINHQVFTHLSLPLEEEIETFGSKYSGKKGEIVDEVRFASVGEIRRSKGYPVNSFNRLVQLVAELGFRNKSFNLLFRGQNSDYLSPQNKMETLYPRIFRPPKGKIRLMKEVIKERFFQLNEAIKILKQKGKEINLHKGLSSYKEYQMALIQHYEILDTPLLDLTHSLHVAASFALLKSKEGYVYVLGMPHTNGSISLFVDHSIRLVKLQNVCPPNALRPHFQNGYLVGRLPFSQSKEAGDNFAYRLICKYKCNDLNGKFWGSGFRSISKNLLTPTQDPFKQILKNLLKMKS